jgi:sarcosine oxidase subunit beta
MASRERADVVVVGAGTIGGWAATFLAEDGAGRVMVLERGQAGQGASSRAAGIVRAQGGTPATVALGRWSIDFYTGQQACYGTDSGFRELGYLIVAITARDEREGRARVAMQQAEGLAVRWLSRSTPGQVNPTSVRTATGAGATSRPTDDRSAAQRPAYALAMQRVGVSCASEPPSRASGSTAAGSSASTRRRARSTPDGSS